MASVSIGVPVFNCESYIKEAIDSLLSQEYSDFHIIISDNCSTDGTANICREYASSCEKISFYQHEVNRGAYWNYQFVLSQADTEFFLWAAGDDVLAPNFISEIMALYKDCPDFVCIMSDVENINAEGNYMHTTYLDNIRYKKSKTDWSNVQKLFFENPTTNIFFCWYGIFRSKILKTASIDYFGKIRNASGSEIPLLAQIALKGKLGSVPLTLKKYRHHDVSMYQEEALRFTKFDSLINRVYISYILMHIIIFSKNKMMIKINLMHSVIRSLFFSLVKF